MRFLEHFRLAIRRPKEAAADADAELRSLLDEQVHDLVARGLPAAAARAEALRRLGVPLSDATTRLHRSAEHREKRMKTLEWLDDLTGDLRYAARTLRRSPSLAAAAVLTLALAVGANTAIFSAVSAVMLRPLPFAQPERLVMLYETNPDFKWTEAEAAPANMFDWKEQVTAFSDVGGYQSFTGTATLTGRGDPELLTTTQVTGNFFDLLGVKAAQGRTFLAEETWNTSPRLVVLSHRAWRTVFGGDGSLVGKSIELGGRPVEVAGILPSDFSVPGVDVDLWLPMRWDRADLSQVWFRRAHFVRPIARLKPGVTHEAANAALQTVVRRLQLDYPVTNAKMGAGLAPLHDFLVGKTKLPLLVMLGAVALLLLIACANVANLLLVRAAGRGREAAVRIALGAGQGRLFRQALAESAVLAGVGGAAGVLLGWWGTQVLAALQPAGMLPVQNFAMSWTVLGYAVGATALAAVVFSLAPTIGTLRRVPADVLRDEGRSAGGSVRTRRWGEALLVGQVALAIALALGAGLLVRSYVALRRVAPGFDPTNVLTTTINLPGFRYDSVAKAIAFFDELEREARALPGVEAAAVVSGLPLGPSMWSSQLAIKGRPPLEGQVMHRELTFEYQRIMRVPLIRGRLFTAADGGDAPTVVLINETLAQMYFKNEDPVGQQVAFDRTPDSTSTWRTIVGVVGDERVAGLGQAVKPEFLAPYAQEPRNGMTLLVRTMRDPAAMAPSVRRIVARMDPKLAITSMATMEEVRAQSLGRDRFLAVLMLSFAGVGLLLGVVGVYGVMAQLARRRMREMGIRIALGAKASQVQWIVVRHGATLAALGIVVGGALALVGGRVIRTLLFQVAPADPVTFVLVPALVLFVAGFAAWLPARRAGRADPCQVLRAD
ncbi:MAG: ABC transporter permease [Gemmatimonadales bacterium]|nr:ABC transporter permease [Gemmatimonadales bacterium]